MKQKKVPRNKIEKLLDIFPQIMFPRGIAMSPKLKKIFIF